MGITLSSPYKNGTLSSIGTGANGANTRLNTSGITWASGDVGRQVYFYNGDANRESREIIAQGTNFCDISFPFGEYPVLKPDGTEVPSNAPSAGNFMGVSYYLDEIDDGVTLIKQTTDFYNHPGGSGNDWTIANGVMVYDVRKTLRISPGWIDLDGILQLGNIDVNGNPINSCGLIGTTTSQGGFGGAGNSVQASSDFGALRMFGGFVSLTATGGTPFWRMHQTGSNSGGPTVFHNINFDGRMGGRIDGEKSYFLNCRFSRLNTTAGPINPESDVAMLQNLNVLSGTQVVYHFWPQSLSTTIPAIRFDTDGITSRFTRMAGSTSLPFVLTLDDVLVDDLQTLQDNSIDLFVQETSSTAAHTVTLKNPLTVNTQNSTSGFRLRITDGSGSEVYNAVSDGSGDWAKATYDWGSLAVAAATVATYDLTDFVEDGPYTCVARKYNKLQQSFTFDARAPQITTIPDVDDTTIVEATEATVAAYTELENLDKLRDRWKEEYTTDFDLDDLIAGATGFATPANCENIVLDKAAGSAFSFNSGTDTATIKTDSTGLVVGSTYSSLALAAGGSLTVTADEEINGLTITGDVNLGSVQDLSSLVVNGALDFSTAGAYNLTSCTITEVTNSSGGSVTLNIDADSTVTTNTGPSITIIAPVGEINFTGLVAGSQVVVCETGTQTEVFRDNSSSTTETTGAIAAGTYDYTVMQAGYFPIRVTGVVVGTSPVPTPIQQLEDRAYQASSGLAFGTTATLTGTDFAVTVATTVQNWYSAWIEFWIAESSLVNTEFPLSTFGPNSFSLNDDYEFTAGSIQYLSRDGFRYMSSGNVRTSGYCAILSQGVTAGLTAEYQQVSAAAPTDAANTGNVDQVIQFYGDATHGNFDYTSYLKFKVQANGYREARADVVGIYGNLEEQLYVISLTTLAIDGLTLGDPAATGITVTKETTPQSYDAGDGAKDFSITILDSGTNTGLTILRELNYNLSLDATYQGLDPFDWPEMVIEAGSAYETSRGVVESDGTPTQHGVFVTRDGANPHPDFTRFQADDGTYGTPLTIVSVTAPNLIDDTRVRLYNVTQASEFNNSVVSGGSGYSISLTEGTDYNSGDAFVLLATYQSGGTAKRVLRSSFTLTVADVSITDSQVDWEEPNVLGIDGSTVSECTTDYVEVEVEVVDSDNSTAKSRIAAFLVDAITTEQGIRDWVSLTGVPVISYASGSEATIDTSVASVTVINTKAATKLLVIDTFILGWSDGVNRADAVLGSSIVWIAPTQALEIAEIKDISTRLDLNTNVPNTYNNDETYISNDNFTLTKTNNGNGTFTVNRS